MNSCLDGAWEKYPEGTQTVPDHFKKQKLSLTTFGSRLSAQIQKLEVRLP